MRSAKHPQLGSSYSMVILAVTIVALLSASLPSLGTRGVTSRVRVNPKESEVGAILGLGDRVGDDCLFDEFRIDQTVNQGDSVWAAIGVDADCTVRLDARWEGGLEGGPRDLVQPLTEVAFDQAAFEADAEARGVMDAVVPAAGSYCTTHEQELVHYGFGGPIDQLTRLRGKMVACETGSGFTSVTQYGTCFATDPPGGWKWLIESCYSGGAWYSVAQTTEKGDYHCDPRATWPCSISNPDGYDHTLTTRERKNADTGGLQGATLCTAWLTGLKVGGTYQTVIQGCH